MNIKQFGFLFILLVNITGCSIYKRDLAFRIDKDHPEYTEAAVNQAITNYKIRKGDLVELKVYTNKGEMLIDPNSELSRVIYSGQSASGKSSDAIQSSPTSSSHIGQYLVNTDGSVYLPLVGRVIVENLTTNQVDSMLKISFEKFYEDPFVVFRVANRRVVVFGGGSHAGNLATGVDGRLIPLPNENTTLVEVLASAGGIPAYADVSNIRLIRGNLKDPTIYKLDISTIAGMKKSNLYLEPNDVIYLEPARRNFFEGARDIIPFSTTILSLATILNLIYVTSKK